MKENLIINKRNVSFSWRNTGVGFNIYLGILNNIAHPFSSSVGTSSRTTRIILNNHTKLAEKNNPSTEKEQTKLELKKIYKKGFVATFNNFED